MTDLLLTHGYFLADDEKERQIMKPYPPLGLLYLSAYLKRAGFSVEVFDSTFRERNELTARFAATPGGVVGIYTNLMTRRSVLEIVRSARRHGWTVVLGGPESANYIGEYLDAGADVIVIGEGELTLADLVPALARRGAHRLHAVNGVAFRDETGAIVRTAERAQNSRPRQPAVAGSRSHRPPALPGRLEDSSRRQQHQPHHGARLPL